MQLPVVRRAFRVLESDAVVLVRDGPRRRKRQVENLDERQHVFRHGLLFAVYDDRIVRVSFVVFHGILRFCRRPNRAFIRLTAAYGHKQEIIVHKNYRYRDQCRQGEFLVREKTWLV